MSSKRLPEAKTEIVMFRVTPAEMTQINSAAKQLEVARSEYLRLKVLAWLPRESPAERVEKGKNGGTESGRGKRTSR